MPIPYNQANMQATIERVEAFGRRLGEHFNGGLVGLALGSLRPMPRREAPIPTEPLEERWAAIAQFPTSRQVVAMEESVYTIIERTGGKIDPYYHFAQNCIELDPEKFTASDLPQEIKDYIDNPPLPAKAGWENPHLWLDSWWWPGNHQFQVTLGKYLEDGSCYWIHAAGVESTTDYGYSFVAGGHIVGRTTPYIRTELAPDWESERTSHLHSPEVDQLTQALRRYVEEAGAFNVAGEIILATAHRVVPTPAANS